MDGEGQFRTRFLQRDNDRLFGERKIEFYLTECNDDDHARIYYDWYFETKGTRKILLEKTPVNSMRMRWLQQWFAPAKFIVIARSPYGVCEGLRRKTGVSIERAAKNWDMIYRTIIETLDHIDNHIVFTYDELTTETDHVLSKLSSFIDLNKPFTDVSNKIMKVHEQQTEIKNMDVRSINCLSKDDISVINKNCAETMRKLRLNLIR